MLVFEDARPHKVRYAGESDAIAMSTTACDEAPHECKHIAFMSSQARICWHGSHASTQLHETADD